MDDQTHCSVENAVELPQVLAIHSSKDSVTTVNATDDQSVGQSNSSGSRLFF